LLQNKFLKNTLTLISGTTAGQALLLLLSPVLTRLYNAEDFGAFGVFVSASSILLVIASLKYELALPMVKRRFTALLLMRLCMILIIGFSLLAIGIIVTFQTQLAVLLNVPNHPEVLFLLPLSLLFCGGYQLATFYSVRESLFKRLSVSKVTQAMAIGIGQVSLSFVTSIGLIYGYVVGFLMSLCCFISIEHPLIRSKKVTGLKLLAVARRYAKFPKYTMWASLTNTSGTVLPVIMFSSLYSSAQAGLYVLAHRVLIAPVNIIGSAISNVFMSNARQYRIEGELAIKTLEIHRQLIALSMPLMALFIFYLTDLFALIFGESWSEAGLLSTYLVIWIYCVFTASPISTVLIVLEKQKLSAYFDVIAFVIRITAVYILSSLPFVQAILIFSLLNAVIVFAFISMTFRQLNVPVWQILKTHVLYAMVFLLPSFGMFSIIGEYSKVSSFMATLLWVVGVVIYMKRKKA
jgi:O-antigen/teichoic acid export membrane protein